MPVHDMQVYWATCDECPWVSDSCDWGSQAEELLDQHIRDNH